jgi:hypothetical protein
MADSPIHCKNCGEHVRGHYCGNCGQVARTQRINVQYILTELQRGLLYFDRGLMYSFRELFSRPGHSIREFLEGKRVRHFKPISMLIILSTFYGLGYHLLGIDAFSEVDNTNNLREGMLLFEGWMETHYSLMELLYLPAFAISSYLAFLRGGYNLIEHIIIAAFVFSQGMFVKFALLPFLYLYNHTTAVSQINNINILIVVGLIFWTYRQLFRHMAWAKTLVLTLLMLLLVFIQVVLAIVVIASAFGYM